MDWSHDDYLFELFEPWRHPFIAEDSLVSDVLFFISEETNSSAYHLNFILDGLGVITFSANSDFWMNYSFNLSTKNV